MMRLAALFWLTVAGIVALFLFHVKYEVQHLEEELQATHRQIADEQEAIHILQADWSYLNRPERISALAKEHLGLQPAETGQLASLDVLPFRPEDMGPTTADGDPLALASAVASAPGGEALATPGAMQGGIQTAAASVAAPPLPRTKPSRAFASQAVVTASAKPAPRPAPERRARATRLPAAVEATLASMRANTGMTGGGLLATGLGTRP